MNLTLRTRQALAANNVYSLCRHTKEEELSGTQPTRCLYRRYRGKEHGFALLATLKFTQSWTRKTRGQSGAKVFVELADQCTCTSLPIEISSVAHSSCLQSMSILLLTYLLALQTKVYIRTIYYSAWADQRQYRLVISHIHLLVGGIYILPAVCC